MEPPADEEVGGGTWYRRNSLPDSTTQQSHQSQVPSWSPSIQPQQLRACWRPWHRSPRFTVTEPVGFQETDSNYNFLETRTARNDASHMDSVLHVEPTEDKPAYEYAPLLRDAMEFRLARLEWDKDGSLFASMIRVGKRPPPYVALSYAWGDLGDTKMLPVESSSVKVSSSLYSALLALARRRQRFGCVSTYIWADALCIDQANLLERNTQIEMMTTIYQNAESVAVWLGPNQMGDNLAFNFLKRLHRSPKPLDVMKCAPKQRLFQVASIFSKPYWNRLWVIQELYNARQIKIYCGDLVASWASFQHAAKIFRSEEGKVLLAGLLPLTSSDNSFSPWTASHDHLHCAQILRSRGPAGFGTIFDTKPGDENETNQSTDEGISQQLLEMMQLSRLKKTTELRDRVFAIRGALPEIIRREIQVDYSLSLKDVYADMFTLIARKTHSLDVLCEAIHFPLYRGHTELPSWMPDWSHTPMVSSLATQNPGKFTADGHLRAVFEFGDVRRNTIKIQGIALGTILKRGCALNTGCRANDYLRAFEGWRLELMNFFRPISVDTKDEAWVGKKEQLKDWIAKEEEFCRVLSLGRVSKEKCYALFAAMLRVRFPYLALDMELKRYADVAPSLTGADRNFLQECFGENMMGRCFCITREGYLGLGSGFLRRGDVVIVAMGCCTPIILRPQGDNKDGSVAYRYVGDIYLHGFMHGEALEGGTREWTEFLLQ